MVSASKQSGGWRPLRPLHDVAAKADACPEPRRISSISLTYDLDIYFNDILKGEWDLRRRVALDSSLKHRSINERFALGFPWEDTELFKSVYAGRLARGECVRGVDNLSDLAITYCSQVDGLFAAMKRDGFVIARDASGRPISFLCLRYPASPLVTALDRTESGPAYAYIA